VVAVSLSIASDAHECRNAEGAFTYRKMSPPFGLMHWP
jgi:hypothetical protein